MPDREIARVLKKIHAERPEPQDRLVAVSALFLGTPYRLGPLGEGKSGEYDRDPLVNFKETDCTTMVEQAMALALEPELKKAVRTLQRIRYKDGRVSYESRNHFPEIDWIPNNIDAGYLRDITVEVAGDKLRYAHKLISKRKWYSEKKIEDLEGFESEAQGKKKERLERLKETGKLFEDRVSTMPYVPVEMIPAVLNRIPSGTIANLVRQDRPDKPVIISHQVLFIDKDGAKFVRHAASGREVEDVAALEYLRRYDGSKWRLVGLNLNRLLAPKKH